MMERCHTRMERRNGPSRFGAETFNIEEARHCPTGEVDNSIEPSRYLGAYNSTADDDLMKDAMGVVQFRSPQEHVYPNLKALAFRIGFFCI